MSSAAVEVGALRVKGLKNRQQTIFSYIASLVSLRNSILERSRELSADL